MLQAPFRCCHPSDLQFEDSWHQFRRCPSVRRASDEILRYWAANETNSKPPSAHASPRQSPRYAPSRRSHAQQLAQHPIVYAGRCSCLLYRSPLSRECIYIYVYGYRSRATLTTNRSKMLPRTVGATPAVAIPSAGPTTSQYWITASITFQRRCKFLWHGQINPHPAPIKLTDDGPALGWLDQLQCQSCLVELRHSLQV